MRTLIVAALALTPPAISADFRGTEFGTSCSAVEEREKALGSVQVPVDAINGSAYRFKGRAFGRDVVITYLCKDGALALGDYHFPEGKYDDAVADYLAAYNSLLLIYGTPFSAFARHGGMTTELAVPVAGAETRDEYHASWRAQDVSVHVDLIAPRDHTGDSWHAMVVTTSAKK